MKSHNPGLNSARGHRSWQGKGSPVTDISSRKTESVCDRGDKIIGRAREVVQPWSQLGDRRRVLQGTE